MRNEGSQRSLAQPQGEPRGIAPVYKAPQGLVKDSTSSTRGAGRRPLVLGELQHSILCLVYDKGLTRFTPRDLAELGVDRRRLHQALSHLVKRGLLRKEARGWYRVVVDLQRYLCNCIVTKRSTSLSRNSRVKDSLVKDRLPRSVLNSAPGPVGSQVKDSLVKDSQVKDRLPSEGEVKDRHGYQVAARGPHEPMGDARELVGLILYDNVRGVKIGGRRVKGDRDRRLLPRELNGFESISYAEPSFISPFPPRVLVGTVVIYRRKTIRVGGRVYRDVVVVEWRPPRGLVKRLGLGRLNSMVREVLLEAWFHLTAVLDEIVGARELRRAAGKLASYGYGSLLASLCRLLASLCPGVPLA